MEYSRSFALLEAVALIALTGWLYYLNSSSARRDRGGEDRTRPEEEGDRDESGQS